MTARSRGINCAVCAKATDKLLEFNTALLCPECFEKEITTFAERRELKPRIAAS